jgi:hypothetical protein
MTGASAREAGRVRVATVITRLEGGAGAQALRGARALDQDAFEIVIITGSGSDRLLMYLTAELWLSKLRSAKPGARAVGPGNP